MRLLTQSTARDVMVFLTDSADHVSGKTGETLTITESKNGGAFGSTSPTVTERGDGWYSIALTSTNTNTVGDYVLHITAAGADPIDIMFNVQASLPANVTTIATNAVNAAALAADAVTEIQSGLATSAMQTTINSNVTANGATLMILVSAIGNEFNETNNLISTIPTNTWGFQLDANAPVNARTALQLMNIMAAILAGKATDQDGSAVYRDLGDTKDRVVGTVSGDDRTITTLDGT